MQTSRAEAALGTWVSRVYLTQYVDCALIVSGLTKMGAARRYD